MKKTSLYPKSEVFDRLISSMSADTQATFTDEQLAALHQACQKFAPRKHAVDLRVSVPVPYSSGLYLVLLAGNEERQANRIGKERKLFWRFTYLFLGSLSLIGVLMIRMPTIMHHATYITNPKTEPTSLPWIMDESDCGGSDRFWEDGACWDRQHDASF